MDLNGGSMMLAPNFKNKTGDRNTFFPSDAILDERYTTPSSYYYYQ